MSKKETETKPEIKSAKKTNGNPGTVTWVDTDFFPIDTTFYIDIKHKDCSMYYLFFELKKQNLYDLSADSAVPGLSRNIVYMNKIIVPDKDVIHEFDKIIKPVFDKINQNNIQTKTLSTLRDSLLPKLMSGELRVPEEIVKSYEDVV